MIKENKILDLTFNFSLQTIQLYKTLVQKNEYVISKQLLRSATSIGANVEEGNAAQKKKILFPKCQSRQKKPVRQNIGLTFYKIQKLQLLIVLLKLFK